MALQTRYEIDLPIHGYVLFEYLHPLRVPYQAPYVDRRRRQETSWGCGHVGRYQGRNIAVSCQNRAIYEDRYKEDAMRVKRDGGLWLIEACGTI
jgi:hypothetical protein